MKRLILSFGVGSLAVLCLALILRERRASSPAAPTRSDAQPASNVVVHEWGTFTGLAGSDGVHLPFGTVVGSDLPPFVMTRLKHASQQNRKLEVLQGLIAGKAGGALVLQRMETPVMYFYADAPTDVSVRVDFPQGLLTEFYPPVQSMGPEYGDAYNEIHDASSTQPASATPSNAPTMTDPGHDGFLDWGHLRIIPHPSGDQGKLVPAADNVTHYAFARDTDAALIQIADAGGAKEPARTFEEKFLFYRGVGNFTLPVSLSAQGGDRFAFRNSGPAAIDWAFLVHVSDDPAKPVRFARFDQLSDARQLSLPSDGEAGRNLPEQLVKSLVSSGLFEKEARAMVRTWEKNWLAEPGTRLLYVVPRAVTDGILPLQITPTPRQTVRVLVGRLDVMTPETESRLRTLLQSSVPEAKLSDDDGRLLAGMGRFLAPALEHLKPNVSDDSQRRVWRMQEMLSEWNRRAK